MQAPDLVNTVDSEGYSPLQLAVIAGNTSLINYLIEEGADLQCTDNEGHTVVHWATGMAKRLPKLRLPKLSLLVKNGTESVKHIVACQGSGVSSKPTNPV